jgi:two-component system OmpR family sensor kinase
MTTASIRFRSAAAISVIVTLIWLCTATITARVLSDEMNEVFDSALQETGQRILQLAVIDVLNREQEGTTRRVMALNEHEEYFTYVVRDDQGRILLTSHRAEPNLFPTDLAPGFHQANGNRMYHEAAVRGTVAISIAEPLDHRREVALEMITTLGLPLLLVIPLSILGIFYGLGFGLRPLGELRQHLGKRGAKHLSPLPVSGMPVELRPIAETINQLFNRLEAAFSAERSFASNAAHELRTPLAGAVAQVQRLRQQTAEPETMRRADDIEQTLKRLTRLSERLIQLARAEGARLTATSPHDIRPVLRIVADDLAHGPDGNRFTLSLPDHPVQTEIDADAIAIVVRNLIENALRHASDGPILVSLDSKARFCVENDCAPISADVLASLCGRFFRGQDAGEGSGLGLAIVHTIADRIGSPLDLTSPLPDHSGGFRACITLRYRQA